MPMRQTFLRFLLSHHTHNQAAACWRIGSTTWWVCARCLGIYPVLFATMAVEPFWAPNLTQGTRAVLFFLLAFPAWIAWAHDRLHPEATWPRMAATLTGIPAGVGAGLVLWGHIRRPFNPSFTFILVLTALASAGVWLLGHFLNPPDDADHTHRPPEE